MHKILIMFNIVTHRQQYLAVKMNALCTSFISAYILLYYVTLFSKDELCLMFKSYKRCI